ncbi:hypothetical protein N7485_010093 [Penicillium canescens]|nr:hypothetical protein N7485_010093 [Penicillium canescens]
MSGESHIAAANCAENIALNYLLHEVPESPQQKPAEPFRGLEKGYSLPFSNERDLVEILSFLAKTKDGPDYIPAVCIEQDRDGTALKALLAINKRTYTDGNGLLQTLKTGFENIFSILRRSLYERGSSMEITKQLLEMIVNMCSSRIACRLRLAGKKWRESKASIKDILQKATEGTQQINPQKLRQSNLEQSLSLFHEKSKRVIQSVNEWSNYRIPSRLNDIVEKIYQLNNVQGLQQLLYLIPTGSNRVINESAFAATLLNIIRKVSRYKEAARVLHRTAKKFPLVRSIEIHLSTLPQDAFDRPHDPAYSPSLSEVLCRLGKINGKYYSISHISRFINGGKIKNPSEQFCEQTTRILREAKIHAEVQLIADCETRSAPLFPRVIGSSKDACFLCHALIHSHGKMYISRTHGRLYPNWRLPAALSFKYLQHRFNDFLLNYARETIRAREKGQTSVHPCPNESTVLPMLTSVSTMSGVQDPVDIATERTASVPSFAPDSEIMKPALSNAVSTNRQSPSANNKLFSSCSLVLSDPFTGLIHTLDSPPFFFADRLHIYLEMEESSTSESTSQFPVYTIEPITVDQVTRLSNESLMVDVMELQGEMTYPLPVDGAIYLTAHDTTVKIVFGQ